jgi:tripartite-type tricarboxylate transporter receptor subunit TctC
MKRRELVHWLEAGTAGPANLPPAVTRRLSDELVATLRAPDVRNQLREGGLVPVGSSATELAKLVRRDVEQRGRLIRAANIKPE